jgi:hypothetical protein
MPYVLVNVAAFLAASAIGALFSSAVAYGFTDYGTVPGPPVQAILGGTLLLLAPLVSIGTPIALLLIAFSWIWTGRRHVSRTTLIAATVFAGVVWVGIVASPMLLSGSLPFTSPAAVSLFAPWLLFGIFLRRRPALLT